MEITFSRKKQQKVVKDRIKNFIRGMKDTPCTDCKISYPYYVTDLDYIGPRRKFSVSMAIKIANPANIEFILKELSVCEPVCSNCHRERDHRRGSRGK